MKIQNPVTFILCFIFLLINIADSITAQFILSGEANPIYLLTGTMFWVNILKYGVVLVLGYICLRNIFSTNFMYYTIIVILIFGTIATLFGVYCNAQGIMHPELLEEVSQITTDEKIDAYFKFMTIIYLIPVIVLFGIFLLYDYSYKFVKIDKKYFEKRAWWKI